MSVKLRVYHYSAFYTMPNNQNIHSDGRLITKIDPFSDDFLPGTRASIAGNIIDSIKMSIRVKDVKITSLTLLAEKEDN